MSVKENTLRNAKIPTTTSIKLKTRPRTDQPKILASKNPGFGVFVHAKSETLERKNAYKISSKTKAKSKQLDSIQEIKKDVRFKAEKSLIEILEKELTNKITDLENKSCNNRILQLDVDQQREKIAELSDVS